MLLWCVKGGGAKGVTGLRFASRLCVASRCAGSCSEVARCVGCCSEVAR